MIEINSQFDFFKNVRLDDDGNLLVALNGSGATEVFMYDTFTDFPATGNADSLYIATDANIIYRYDTLLNTYVILNDPNVINPDAPEEGATYYVRLATASALNACTYDNGTAGVGATLTATANGILSQTNQTGRIDNTVPVLGDVILVKNQAARLQNGIYEITQLGDGSNPFILTRIDGYNETDEVYPSIVFVSAGSSNINRYFTQSTSNPVIGTSNLIYGVATTSQPVATILFCDTVLDLALSPAGFTYTNGTAFPTTLPGYGATLTATSNGAFGTIGGLTITSGLRLIVMNQVNPAHNGTYTVTNAGSATQPWVLTRWVSDSSFRYNIREYHVTNPSSSYFGSIYTITSPLSMSNANYGITPIIFEKQNIYGLKNSSNSIYINGAIIGVSDFTIETDNTVGLGVYSGLDESEFSVEVGAINSTVTDGTDTSSIEINGSGTINLDASNEMFLNGNGVQIAMFTNEIEIGATRLSLNAVTSILINTYANDAAADADTELPSGGLYKLTGNRTVFQKP